MFDTSSNPGLEGAHHLSLKRLIKAMLPRSLLHAAVTMRDARTFASTPRENFDARNLRLAARLDLQSIFNNRVLAEAWRTDQAAIAPVFGAGEWFEKL
jgi:hypothetical protein